MLRQFTLDMLLLTHHLASILLCLLLRLDRHQLLLIQNYCSLALALLHLLLEHSQRLLLLRHFFLHSIAFLVPFSSREQLRVALLQPLLFLGFALLLR